MSNNISLTGSSTQQVLVYGVTIRKVNNRWQVRYKYDGEMGSFLLPSLRQCIKWCDERELKYDRV